MMVTKLEICTFMHCVYIYLAGRNAVQLNYVTTITAVEKIIATLMCLCNTREPGFQPNQDLFLNLTKQHTEQRKSPFVFVDFVHYQSISSIMCEDMLVLFLQHIQ